MRLTESINSSFKLSNFLEIYEHETDKTNVYLYSYISHRKVLISIVDYNLLLKKSIQSIEKKTLGELIHEEILIPDIIDEQKIIVNYLQNLNKLTVVFDDENFSINIFQLLKNNRYNDICLLFALQKKKNITFIKAELLKYSPELENISILRLEKEEINSFISKIHIYKSINAFVDEKLIYSHSVVHSIDEYETYTPSITEEKISFKEVNGIIPDVYLDKLTRPKSINSLSLLYSSHHYIKELPISGFIVDHNRLSDFIQDQKINEQCINCSILPICGGYVEGITVECPSYKNTHLKNFSKENERASQNNLIGISNTLVLKSEIVDYFEKMVCRNVTNHSEYIAILYLNKEYLKGFIHAKEGRSTEADATFASADKLTKKILPQSGFSYNYVQTFITSTKSYLAFKINKKEESIDITKEGIRYAINLNKYMSVEIISLYISQMLMNMSKVYLSLNDLEKWEKTTLANINFLLNHDLPIEADGYDIALLEKTPDNLKYFMLLEVINQVLTHIIKKNFEPGLKLLRKIYVKDLSKEVNKQIFEWITLINISYDSNVNILDYEARYLNFYSSKNEIINLVKLKFFLRFSIKKLGSISDLEGSTAQ